MVIKKLYESLLQSINEARITRTIDKKLWLTVASICSRNKSTEAEFIKPLSKMDTNELLNRYVAALLIMKKPCPETKEEIEKIKTFKLFGLKYLKQGGTIDNIKNLFVKNGGTGVSITTTANPVIKTELEQEIKEPITKQVKQTESQTDIKPNKLETALLSKNDKFTQIYNDLKQKQNDNKTLVENIYNELVQNKLFIQKTFHKINLNKNEVLYFTSVTTDFMKSILVRNTKEINISWILLNNKKVRLKEEGNLSIIINNFYNTSNDIKLNDNISISPEQFNELLVIILAKLLYMVKQNNEDAFTSIFVNKEISNLPTKIPTSFGSFGNKPLDFNKPFKKQVVAEILAKIKYRFTTIKPIFNYLELFLQKYKMGNENNGLVFKLNFPILSVYCGWPRRSKIITYVGVGFFYNNKFMQLDGYINSNPMNTVKAYARDSYKKEYEQICWSDKIYSDKETMLLVYQTIFAVFLYYTNNYDQFIK